MKRYGSLTLVLLAAACPLLAQSQKDMTLALQRDVAALRDDIKKIQTDQEVKLGSLTENLRTTIDSLRLINDKLTAIQTTTETKLNDITRQVGAPTQALSQKVDAMNDQFLNLSNTVAELNSRLGKIDSKLEDVKKMIQTIPPPTATLGGQPQASNGGGTAPMVSGEKLFDDANRDYLAGNVDLALQGFNEYMRNFAETQRAPDAQFYIAELYSRKEDWNGAVTAYDLVIKNYPDSSRVPNAHYMRGVALVKNGQRADGAKEFKFVIDKYPTTELAKKSKDYLKVLGVPVSQAPAQKKTAKRH